MINGFELQNQVVGLAREWRRKQMERQSTLATLGRDGLNLTICRALIWSARIDAVGATLAVETVREQASQILGAPVELWALTEAERDLLLAGLLFLRGPANLGMRAEVEILAGKLGIELPEGGS